MQTLIITLIAVFLLLLLLRDIIIWFFKIDVLIKDQKEIIVNQGLTNELLERIAHSTEAIADTSDNIDNKFT